MMLRKLPDMRGFRFFLNSRSFTALILKCLLLLAVPYAYLMLCGLLFDYLLKWYFMTAFIFVSLALFFTIALAIIIWANIRYFRQRRKGGLDGTGRNQACVQEHRGSV
ncbi:MAG: hypothetical protein EOM54_10550 [Clostridia bacterium]|nr:hypothetical protein [Clostridia bacterium]